MMENLLEYVDKLKKFAKDNNIAILKSTTDLYEIEEVRNIREISIGESNNLIQQSNHVLSINRLV